MVKFKKIIRLTFVFVALVGIKNGFSQSLNTGISILNNKWILNTSFRTPLDDKHKLSLSGLYQMDQLYGEKGKSMVIAAMGYAIKPQFHTLLGTFYTNSLKWNPSVSFQYIWSQKNLKGVVYPIFILHDPVVNLTFFRIEYFHSLTAKIDCLIRFQPYIVSGYWKHYYTRAGTRFGIKLKTWEIGLALDNDFVGKELNISTRVGIFIQKQFIFP